MLKMKLFINKSGILFTVAVSAFFTANIYATETVIYSEGFESNNGMYTHTGTFDTWEWGIPSANFVQGPRSAHSGTKCWGTDLDGSVPLNSNAYLTSPAITLPSIGTDSVLRVRFFGWVAVDLMSDRGEFQVSSNAVDWVTKAKLLCVMQEGWNEYAFDISNYAGGAIYLRFRCMADGEHTFSPPEVPQNMAGYYIDDIAITLTRSPATKKKLTFEGSESQNTIASCPWICIPKKSPGNSQHGNSPDFIEENDIYSTARGSEKEYTDYYQLVNSLPVDDDSTCVVKLKETEQEESFTDLLHLIVIEHQPDVEIACDDSGNVFTYKKNKTSLPTAAIDKNGVSVLNMIESPEEYGYKAFNEDYVELTFTWSGNVPHPILLLKAQGFMADGLIGTHTQVTPKIEVQTQNSSGQWVTRHLFYPRWKPAQCGYDLAGHLPYSKKVRLLSSSCHTGKYNYIDWVALSTESQKTVTITDLAPVSAIRSDGIDVTSDLQMIDNQYLHLITNEEVLLLFKLQSKVKDNKFDFIIKSKGYYNPTGTYFFYTWNGSAWTQRDGWTIPLDGDQTRQFDFSLWLPDPTGQNRVRIWQDFIFDEAAIDYVGLRRDSIDLIMSYATDLRNNNSILNQLNLSDNQRLFWDYGEDWPHRIRWVEVGWSDTFVNTPPSADPVFVTNTGVSLPTINWTYFDLDGNAQNMYEVEVWTGAGGTGNNIWDPQPWQGCAQSVGYSGVTLTSGQKYYARVKVFDGKNWGGWSESYFIISANRPPVANAGNDTVVIALPSCITTVALNGSRSYDPDGDTLQYVWSGPFGIANGAWVAVALFPDTARIHLIVFDGKGGSGVDSVTVIVKDTVSPIPDLPQLSTITGDCLVAISNPPTATDNCAGTIVGVTPDPLSYSQAGNYTIVWYYRDLFGNTTTQTQMVRVLDTQAPVPNVSQLPGLQGSCSFSVTTFPTATDNCRGLVAGTTTDPLTYSNKGTYTIHWSYEDGNGNTSLQSQTVTVIDNTAPVPAITPLPAINGIISTNRCYTVRTYPTANDNCKGRVVATTSSPLRYCYRGKFTIVWKYSDGNGNITTQNQTVNIR
ncbi:MAG: hypothetical protein JW915_10720 [Chitinispirillaceae bacterium]|nr:hypothetical protein [Chitinispirillaceae bacterium]